MLYPSALLTRYNTSSDGPLLKEGGLLQNCTQNPNPQFVSVPGDSASLWFRPLRQLFESGKPPGLATILTFGPLPEGNLPFGAICRTRHDRVVFWPVLPVALPLFGDERTQLVTDHVTLELSNDKIHATSYDRDGSCQHHRRGWRLQHLPDAGVAKWFELAVRRSVLQEQHNAVERNVRIPTRDRDRRLAEYRRYAEQMKIQAVRVPPEADRGTFFYCAVYVERGESAQPQVTDAMSRLGPFPDRLIHGWPDDHPIVVQPMRVALADLRLLLVTGAPPGELSQECFGFPRASVDDPHPSSGPHGGPHGFPRSEAE